MWTSFSNVIALISQKPQVEPYWDLCAQASHGSPETMHTSLAQSLEHPVLWARSLTSWVTLGKLLTLQELTCSSRGTLVPTLRAKTGLKEMKGWAWCLAGGKDSNRWLLLFLMVIVKDSEASKRGAVPRASGPMAQASPAPPAPDVVLKPIDCLPFLIKGNGEETSIYWVLLSISSSLNLQNTPSVWTPTSPLHVCPPCLCSPHFLHWKCLLVFSASWNVPDPHLPPQTSESEILPLS